MAASMLTRGKVVTLLALGAGAVIFTVYVKYYHQKNRRRRKENGGDDSGVESEADSEQSQRDDQSADDLDQQSADDLEGQSAADHKEPGKETDNEAVPTPVPTPPTQAVEPQQLPGYTPMLATPGGDTLHTQEGPEVLEAVSVVCVSQCQTAPPAGYEEYDDLPEVQGKHEKDLPAAAVDKQSRNDASLSAIFEKNLISTESGTQKEKADPKTDKIEKISKDLITLQAASEDPEHQGSETEHQGSKTDKTTAIHVKPLILLGDTEQKTNASDFHNNSGRPVEVEAMTPMPVNTGSEHLPKVPPPNAHISSAKNQTEKASKEPITEHVSSMGKIESMKEAKDSTEVFTPESVCVSDEHTVQCQDILEKELEDSVAAPEECHEEQHHGQDNPKVCDEVGSDRHVGQKEHPELRDEGWDEDNGRRGHDQVDKHKIVEVATQVQSQASTPNIDEETSFKTNASEKTNTSQNVDCDQDEKIPTGQEEVHHIPLECKDVASDPRNSGVQTADMLQDLGKKEKELASSVSHEDKNEDKETQEAVSSANQVDSMVPPDREFRDKQLQDFPLSSETQKSNNSKLQTLDLKEDRNENVTNVNPSPLERPSGFEVCVVGPDDGPESLGLDQEEDSMEETTQMDVMAVPRPPPPSRNVSQDNLENVNSIVGRSEEIRSRLVAQQAQNDDQRINSRRNRKRHHQGDKESDKPASDSRQELAGQFYLEGKMQEKSRTPLPDTTSTETGGTSSLSGLHNKDEGTNVEAFTSVSEESPRGAGKGPDVDCQGPDTNLTTEKVLTEDLGAVLKGAEGLPSSRQVLLSDTRHSGNVAKEKMKNSDKEALVIQDDTCKSGAVIFHHVPVVGEVQQLPSTSSTEETHQNPTATSRKDDNIDRTSMDDFEKLVDEDDIALRYDGGESEALSDVVDEDGDVAVDTDDVEVIPVQGRHSQAGLTYNYEESETSFGAEETDVSGDPDQEEENEDDGIEIVRVAANSCTTGSTYSLVNNYDSRLYTHYEDFEPDYTECSAHTDEGLDIEAIDDDLQHVDARPVVSVDHFGRSLLTSEVTQNMQLAEMGVLMDDDVAAEEEEDDIEKIEDIEGAAIDSGKDCPEGTESSGFWPFEREENDDSDDDESSNDTVVLREVLAETDQEKSSIIQDENKVTTLKQEADADQHLTASPPEGASGGSYLPPDGSVNTAAAAGDDAHISDVPTSKRDLMPTDIENFTKDHVGQSEMQTKPSENFSSTSEQIHLTDDSRTNTDVSKDADQSDLLWKVPKLSVSPQAAKMTFEHLEASRGKMTSTEAQVLTGLLATKDDALLEKTLVTIANASAFTSNQNLLREAGCLTHLVHLVHAHKMALRVGQSVTYPAVITRVVNTVTNLAVNEENQKQLQECIPALIDFAVSESAPESVQVSSLQALTNLSVTSTYHPPYTKLIQHLYECLDNGSGTVQLHALKVLVNLSSNPDMVPHLLAAKAPSCLLSIIVPRTEDELLIRWMTLLANIMWTARDRHLTNTSLPTEYKAPSPETMWTALYGLNSSVHLRSKVFVLSKHKNQEIRYHAARIYSYLV